MMHSCLRTNSDGMTISKNFSSPFFFFIINFFYDPPPCFCSVFNLNYIKHSFIGAVMVVVTCIATNHMCTFLLQSHATQYLYHVFC